MRRWARFTAVVTVAALATSAGPAAAAALPRAPKTAPPAAPPQGFVEGVSEELPALRTLRSKTYRNPDGTYTEEQSTGPIHVKEGGRWTDLDTTLETGKDGKHRGRKLPFGMTFGDENTGEVSTLSFGGSTLGLTLRGARKGDKPKTHKNTIRYSNVFPGVDLHYRVHGEGFKESLILAKPGAPTSYTFDVRSSPDLVLTKQPSGLIEITRSGKEVAEIPPPYMGEAEEDDIVGARSYDVSYVLEGEPGAYTLTVNADAAWLASPDRKYPVVIDPAVTLGTGKSNDQTTCSATHLANTYYNEIAVGYESVTPLGWCKGWMRWDLSTFSGKTVTNADVSLFLYHSYDNKSSLTYMDRLAPVDFTPPVAENDMTYRGGAYRPYRHYSSVVAGEDVGGLGNGDKYYGWDVTPWAQANRGDWAGLMLESGANGYTGYSSTVGQGGTATIAQELYKIFRPIEYGDSTVRPKLAVTYTTATPAVPTGLYPGTTYLSRWEPTYFYGTFSDPDAGNGHLVYEVWNEALTAKKYGSNGSTVASGDSSYWYPPVFADGKYKWRAAANDGTLQSAWTAWRSMTIDITPPATPTSLYWSQGNVTASSSITANWTDGPDTSGITNHYMRVSTAKNDPSTSADEFAANAVWSGYTNSASDSFTLTSAHNITPGRTYYFKVYSFDAAGSNGTYSAESPGILVDQVGPSAPPTLVSTSHSTTVPSQDQTIDVTWTASSDDASGVAAYEVLFDQTETAGTGVRTVYGSTSRTATSTPRTDGAWYAHVRAYDYAGNRGPDKTYGPMTVDTVDPGTPSVFCPSHYPQGTWQPTRQLTCDFTPPAGSGTTAYSVVLDKIQSTVPPESANHHLPTYATNTGSDGAFWLHVRGIDAAGNGSATAAPWRVLSDETGPEKPVVSSGTHPVAADWHSNNDPNLTWEGTEDGAPIDGYSYAFDQLPGTTPLPVLSNDQSHQVTDVADGVWYLHARARNAAGLWGDTVHRAVKVDVTAPEGALPTSRTHPDNDPVSVSSVTMSWADNPGSDATSGIAGYSYAFTADVTTPIDSTVDTTGTEVTQTLADGTWYFHLRTVDRAGNATERVYGPIRIDQNGPPVTTTDRNRFTQLWVPRVESDTYYKDWFASDGVPASVLAEGFHGMSLTQQRYLADALWAEFAARNNAEPDLAEAGRQVMWEYVFDKEKQEHAPDIAEFDPSEYTATQPGPDLDKPDPADLVEMIQESAGTYVPLPDTDVPAAIVESLEVPSDAEVPDLPTGEITKTLSTDAQAELDKMAAPENAVNAVTERLAQLDGELDLGLDPRSIFGLPDRLPINYTVCWDVAGTEHDDCEDALTIESAVDIDLSGDGTKDATAKFEINKIPTGTEDLTSFAVRVKRFEPNILQAQSDLAGQPLKAHIWVVYDLGAPGGSAGPGRLQLGFDGLVRGERLAEDTTLKLTPNALLDLAFRDFSARYEITHTWPDETRPKWALTVGTRNIDGDADPLDAALTYPAAVDTIGTVQLRHDDNDDPVYPFKRGMKVTFQTAVPDGVVADVRQRVEAVNETTSAHVVLPSIPAGTTFDTTRSRTQLGAERMQANIDLADAATRLARIAGIYTVVNNAGESRLTFDLREVATSTEVVGLRTSASQFDFHYDSDAASGAMRATIREIDADGVLQLAAAARSTSLPTVMDVTYGPSETADDRTMFTLTSSARFNDMAFTGYDRQLGTTVDASLGGVPTALSGEMSPGGSYGSIDVLDGTSITSAIGVMSTNGGKVSRRPGGHATLHRRGSALGMSFHVRNATHGLVEIADKVVHGNFAVVAGSLGTKVPFTMALDLDGVVGYANLRNLPASADVLIDLRTPSKVHLEVSSVVVRATVFGRLPSGLTIDGALGYIQAGTVVDGTLTSDSVRMTYAADSEGADVERFMFSTDAAPADGSGLTARMAASDLPQRMTVTGNRTERTLHFKGTTAAGAAAGVGMLEASAGYNGARPKVLDGQHLTFRGGAAAWALSGRVYNLTQVDVDVNSALTAGHALVLLTQQGGALTADVDLDGMRFYAKASNVPSRMEVWGERDPLRIRYLASERVPRVDGYASFDAGHTVAGFLENAPSSATLTVSEPRPDVWAGTFSSAEPVGRVALYYSPKVLPRGVTPTDDFVAIDASGTTEADMPKQLTGTFDLGAKKVQWRSTTRTGQVKLLGRGTGDFLYGYRVNALVQGVPAEFDATFSPDEKLFDGRGGTVGFLDIQASNHGLLRKPADSRHLYGRFDLSDGDIDLSARLDDVEYARFVTGDKAISMEGKANATVSVAVDVEVDDLVPAAGSTEFRVSVSGKVSRLPESATVTAKEGLLVYDSVGRLGGQLSVGFGWAPAIPSAPPSTLQNGISVIDGACGPTACDPGTVTAPRFMCDAADRECYGVRALITHPSIPTFLSADIRQGLTLPLIEARGLAAGKLGVKADLDDMVDDHMIIEATQHDIVENTSLVVGPIKIERPVGSSVRVSAHVGVTPAAGTLKAKVSMPETVWTFGGTQGQPNYRISKPVAEVDIVDMPSSLDVTADLTGGLHAEVTASGPTREVAVRLDALVEQRRRNGSGYDIPENKWNPGCPSSRFCAAVKLGNLPTSATEPIVVDGRVARHKDAKNKIVTAPTVSFTAPAAGATLSANVDPGLVALLDGDLDLYFTTLSGEATATLGTLRVGAERLGTGMHLVATGDRREVTVTSTGTTGSIWVKADDFNVTVSGEAFGIPVKTWAAGLAELSVRVGGTLQVKGDATTVRLTEFTSATLTADHYNYGLGISGSYGTFELTIDNFALELNEVAIRLRVRLGAILPWKIDVFSPTVHVGTGQLTLHDFYAVSVKADEYGSFGPTFKGGFGGVKLELGLMMKPWPTPADNLPANLVRLHGSDGRQIFSLNPLSDNRLVQRFFGLLLATVYNPYDNTSMTLLRTS